MFLVCSSIKIVKFSIVWFSNYYISYFWGIEFIDNKYRGAGIGKKLITYAIDNLQVTKVDVNEQNVQAVGFYKYMGFNIYKRSNLDGEGKEYPILHMQL